MSFRQAYKASATVVFVAAILIALVANADRTNNKICAWLNGFPQDDYPSYCKDTCPCNPPQCNPPAALGTLKSLGMFKCVDYTGGYCASEHIEQPCGSKAGWALDEDCPITQDNHILCLQTVFTTQNCFHP